MHGARVVQKRKQKPGSDRHERDARRRAHRSLVGRHVLVLGTLADGKLCLVASDEDGHVFRATVKLFHLIAQLSLQLGVVDLAAAVAVRPAFAIWNFGRGSDPRGDSSARPLPTESGFGCERVRPAQAGGGDERHDETGGRCGEGFSWVSVADGQRMQGCRFQVILHTRYEGLQRLSCKMIRGSEEAIGCCCTDAILEKALYIDV